MPAAPALDAQGSGSPFHLEDRRSATFGGQSGKRPSIRIENSHPAYGIDENGDILVPAHRDLQNLLSLPQQCAHERLIDPARQTLARADVENPGSADGRELRMGEFQAHSPPDEV